MPPAGGKLIDDGANIVMYEEKPRPKDARAMGRGGVGDEGGDGVEVFCNATIILPTRRRPQT